MSFEPDGDPQAIHEAVIALKYPQLIKRAESNAQRISALMAESGYTALREGSELNRDWLSFDSRSSIDQVYMGRDGSAVGHVSLTRSYPKAWTGHQLATRTDHEEKVDCWKALYGLVCFGPTLHDGDDANLIAYFDPTRRWFQRFYIEFAEWLGQPEHALVSALDRFELKAGTGGVLCADGTRIEIRPAYDWELREAYGLIDGQLPPLVAKIMDLAPHSLRARNLHSSYANSGVERSREVLVARQGGRMIAAVLCERGSAALSIFGLFNMALVFMPRGAGAPSVDAQATLLEAVRAWYQTRGVADPIITAPPGAIRPDAHPAVHLEETMGVVAWSALGLGHYQNYLHYTLGRANRAERSERADRKVA